MDVYLKPQKRLQNPNDARNYMSKPRQSNTSLSPKRSKASLKPLISQSRAWIPGGHPNSIGRNKLGSMAKDINMEY